MSKKIKNILLLDISHLFFRAFYAFPNNLIDPQKKPINAIFGVAQMLLSVIEKEKPDFIFGGKDLSSQTIRHKEMPEYKGGRPELDDDLRIQIPRVFHFFDALSLPVFYHQGWEADDIIASISEKFRGNYEYQISILTGDADALQLIGENINVLKPTKGGNELITKEKLFEKKSLYPEEIIDFKAIAGDPSDNLKGIVGIGEKGAIELIRNFGNLENIYNALEQGIIKGSKAKKLEEGKENAFFTRKMATLNRNLLLPEFDTEKGNIQNFSLQKAIEYFQNELGSRSLQTRITTILNPYLSEKINEEQRSLF